MVTKQTNPLFRRIIISVIVFVVTFHLLVNTLFFQKFSLAALRRILNVEITLDQVKINGFLGKLAGKNISLTLPKTKTQISLNNFSLILNPMKLFVGGIHLYDLQAEGLSIIGGEKQVPENLPPIPAIDKEETEIFKLLSHIDVDHALLQKLSFTSATKGNVSIDSVVLHSSFSLLKFSRSISLIVNNIALRSPKVDLFLDAIQAEGKADFVTLKDKRILPTWDGNINISSLFFGLNKNPNPWNDYPICEESILEFVHKYYPEGIPENRSFGMVNKATLPLILQPNQAGLRKAQIELFGGLLWIDGLWKNKKLFLNIKTPAPLNPALLPLGKAQFRQLYSQANLDLNFKGKLEGFNTADLTGDIAINLKGNKAVTDSSGNPGPDTNIEGKIDFKNKIAQLNNFQIKVGDGVAKVEGSVDFTAKEFKSNIDGKNLPAQTIIRAFSTLNFPAIADVQGKIEGLFKNPTFDLNIASTDAAYESFHFGNTKARLTIRDGNMDLDGNALLAETGSTQVKLKVNSVFKSSLMSMDMDASFKNMPAGALMNNDHLTGIAEGNIELHDREHLSSGKGSVSVRDLTWFGVPVTTAKADLLIGERELTIKPIALVLEPESPSRTPKPLHFKFQRDSYAFEGQLLPTISVTGGHAKVEKGLVHFQLKADKTDFKFLSPLFNKPVDSLWASGTLTGTLNTSSPINSDIDAILAQVEYLSEEQMLKGDSRTHFYLKNKQLIFDHSSLHLGAGQAVLNGAIGLEGKSDLQIKGTLDLDQIALFIPWLVEGQGLAKTDITLTGPFSEPTWRGNIVLNEADLNIAGLEHDVENANGTIRFDEKKIIFDKTHLLYDDGPLTLDGWMEWKTPSIESADLSISGKDVPLSSTESWQTLVDAQVQLHGSGDNLSLDGDINLVEGLYYKDYSLSNYILKPIGVLTQPEDSPFWLAFSKTKLNINLKSSGEFEIRNNLADMALKGNLRINGSINDPIMTGAVDVVDGQIHAFGIDFENATGFANFSTQFGQGTRVPFIEFSATHPIQDFEIRVRIKGLLDNLALELESVPSLNNNEIVSLIAYGRTPDQLTGADRNIFSTNAIASQILGVLQRPLSKATKLDIVKLETDYSLAEPTPSRFSIGKKLSDRISLAFTTDLSLEEAQKGVALEYLILDNILLKGIKDTGSRYRFDLTYRFETF